MNTKNYTSLLAITTIIICFIGIISIYSSSSVFSIVHFKTSFYYFYKQIAGYVLFFFIIGLLNTVDKKTILQQTSLFFFVSLVVCILPHIPIIGISLNGAKRWINCFLFIAQPVEIYKPICILFASKLFIKHYFQKNKLIFDFCLLAFLTITILLSQPDYGQMIIILITLFCMIFSIQNNNKMIALIAFIGTLGLVFLALLKPYRLKRILIFLYPFDDPQGKGFQIIQSLIAIFQGGLWGKGIGYSHQKISHLPMQHTDFIFSIICEETGLIGAATIIVLISFMGYCLLKISQSCECAVGKLYTSGVAYLFLFQSFINIYVALAALPTKGIGLPLISYGISSLVGYGITFGLVYSLTKK
jgi:cell division protein FtsW